MGSSFTNVHVKSGNQNAVKAALTELNCLPAFVSRPTGGWVSAFCHATESQDEAVLKATCQDLSAKLNTGVIGFIVHDSDILIYSLAESGKLSDHYHSWPGYFQGGDDAPTGGITEKLLPYCKPGTSSEEVEKVLRSGGKGLPGGMADLVGQFNIGAVKKKAVKASPWWAKPAVWGALSIMEAASKKNSGQSPAPPAVPDIPADLADNVFRGDRLASALAILLGIDEDCMVSGYSHIQDDDAAVSRRSLAHIGEALAVESYEPTAEQQAQAGEMMKEMLAPLSQRPSYIDFLQIVKNLLDTPIEQESFKSACLAQGLEFKQTTINTFGLTKAPVFWTFTYEADKARTRKFSLSASPDGSRVQFAATELCKILPGDSAPDTEESLVKAQAGYDSEFDYGFSKAVSALGPPALQNTDGGGNRYVAWRGKFAILFLYQSPGDDLSPYKTIELWWEPWSGTSAPQIDGVLNDWLHKRHPGFMS